MKLGVLSSLLLACMAVSLCVCSVVRAGEAEVQSTLSQVSVHVFLHRKGHPGGDQGGPRVGPGRAHR